MKTDNALYQLHLAKVHEILNVFPKTGESQISVKDFQEQ